MAPAQGYSLIKGQFLSNSAMEGTEFRLVEGYEGRYKESKESDGVWLLEEVTITDNHRPNIGWMRLKRGDGEKLVVSFCDTKVGVDVSDEMFTLQGLGVDDGTKVYDKHAGKVVGPYYYGSIREDSNSQSILVETKQKHDS